VVGHDQRLVCRLTGQLTDDHLLPSTEAFSIGGMTTVRGYSNGLLSGDKGYVLSAEYNFPMQFLKSNKVNGLVFIDHGGTFPFKGNNESASGHDYLTSTGFGVNFTCFKYLSGKIILGCPINPPENEDGFKIHFILQSALF
jgi:hemolysin activation/secretion protein